MLHLWLTCFIYCLTLYYLLDNSNEVLLLFLRQIFIMQELRKGNTSIRIWKPRPKLT